MAQIIFASYRRLNVVNHLQFYMLWQVNRLWLFVGNTGRIQAQYIFYKPRSSNKRLFTKQPRQQF